MDREEILAKSRAENKNQDMYEKEVLKQGQAVSAVVILILATVFFVVQIIVGGGINYGIYAIVLSGSGAMFWVKWIKLRRRHEFLMAILYTVIVLALSAVHIYNLTTASAVL